MFCRQSPDTAVIMFAGIVGFWVSVYLLIIHSSCRWDFKLSVKPIAVWNPANRQRLCPGLGVQAEIQLCALLHFSQALRIVISPSVAVSWLFELRDLHSNDDWTVLVICGWFGACSEPWNSSSQEVRWDLWLLKMSIFRCVPVHMQIMFIIKNRSALSTLNL